jgi:hypothetical protein
VQETLVAANVVISGIVGISGEPTVGISAEELFINLIGLGLGP